MKNRIRQLREKKGLSQQALATAVGTSQQQIQRLEAGRQAVKLDLSMRISSALGAEIGVVFPDTRKALKETGQKSLREVPTSGLYNDQSAVRAFDAAGLDVGLHDWIIKTMFRNGRTLSFPISSADRLRLHRAYQQIESMDGFFRFTSHSLDVALNLRRLVFYHEMFEPQGIEPEWHDDELSLEQVSLFFSNQPVVVRLSVDPDENDAEDDEELGQLNHLMWMAEALVDESDGSQIMDVDGETACFRLSEVDLITIPMKLLDDQLYMEDAGVYESVEIQNEEAKAEEPSTQA